MPQQRYPQQPSVEPSCETVKNNAKNSAVTPTQTYNKKAPLTTPNLATKPKGTIKPRLTLKMEFGPVVGLFFYCKLSLTN